MHDTFEETVYIHQEGDVLWALFGCISDLEIIMSFHNEEVAVYSGRRKGGTCRLYLREGRGYWTQGIWKVTSST
jgi:hypothetical protein